MIGGGGYRLSDHTKLGRGYNGKDPFYLHSNSKSDEGLTVWMKPRQCSRVLQHFHFHLCQVPPWIPVFVVSFSGTLFHQQSTHFLKLHQLLTSFSLRSETRVILDTQPKYLKLIKIISWQTLN